MKKPSNQAKKLQMELALFADMLVIVDLHLSAMGAAFMELDEQNPNLSPLLLLPTKYSRESLQINRRKLEAQLRVSVHPIALAENPLNEENSQFATEKHQSDPDEENSAKTAILHPSKSDE